MYHSDCYRTTYLTYFGNHDHLFLRCYSEGATDIVKDLCEGKTICSPDVSDQTFGDPCHKIYKYLEVDFDCVPVRDYISDESEPGTY